MIRNFEIIREQLKELAGVINSFKSEAVQLRLIELVFEAAGADADGEVKPAEFARKERRGARPKTIVAKSQLKEAPPKSKSSARPGGKAMLDRLHSEAYFKKARTINQLVDHCEQNLAFKYKQSDFSGALGRLTREGTLKRTKNAENQYEYSEA